VAETAAHYKVGWATVHEAFIAHVAAPLAAPAPPVKVLGIDETRRGKPTWAQDPDTHRWQLVCDRWHTGFVDATGTGGLLAQVQGRSAAAAALTRRGGCGAGCSPPTNAYVPRRSPRCGMRWRTPVRRGSRSCTPTSSRKSYGPRLPCPGLTPNRTCCAASFTTSTPVPPLGRPRNSPPRHHHRDLVAGDRSRHPHRPLQRPLRGLQPTRETRRPQRLRLPQPNQPTPPHTLGLHPPTPASASHHHRAARSSATSHFGVRR